MRLVFFLSFLFFVFGCSSPMQANNDSNEESAASKKKEKKKKELDASLGTILKETKKK